MHPVQPEQASYGAGSRNARLGISRQLRATARAFVVLAALLAFGLFGLLVVVWRAAWRKRRVEQDCRGCRRRRYLTLAVTSVLAGLVSVGVGLSVYQHTSGPSLPTCGIERSAHVQGPLPSTDAGGTVWSKSRQILTAPVSGLTRHYVNDRGGGLCEVQSMTVGFLPSAAADSGVAVGGVAVIDASSRASAGDWEALAPMPFG